LHVLHVSRSILNRFCRSKVQIYRARARNALRVCVALLSTSHPHKLGTKKSVYGLPL
jgi:hypothetical protein